MTNREKQKQLYKLASLLVPLILFFVSEHIIGYFQQQLHQQSHFHFSIPLDTEFADAHNISPSPDIDKVFVTGFFSDWAQDDKNYQLQQTAAGKWQLPLQLPPGDIQYKFVIFIKGDPNGKWLLDPLNPLTTSDSHDGRNSLLKRPDYVFYQLVADIITLGVFIFFASLFSLQKVMKWLMKQPLSLANTFITGTMLVVLLSNISLAFYQVFESRKLIQQGVLDAIHQSHLYLNSAGIHFTPLIPDEKALKQQLHKLFWDAKTRVENYRSSVTQITLSDIAVYDTELNLIHVQSRQQNHGLQLARAQKTGLTTLQNYFSQGVFAPLLAKVDSEPDIQGFITAHPAQSIIDIETPETRFGRQLLGFSNMLVPIVEGGKTRGYYAVAIQVKLFGKEILRIILANILLILITLLFAYFLLRSVGKMASANLQQLTQWAQKINQGDFSGEVKMTTRDEVKVLADNFSEMQRSLKTSFTQIEQQNLQLNKAAYFDLETELPNLKKMLIDQEQHRESSVILLELAKFEQLQTFLGETVTHQVIEVVLARLATCIKSLETAQIYRIAPNQFCVVHQEAELIRSETTANTMVRAINSDPLVIDNIALNIEACAGICCRVLQGDSIREQLERAILALSEAKAKGVSYCVYKQVMDKGEILKHNIQMIRRVRTAIQRDKVVAFFQPIVTTATKEIVALECLVRIKESDNLILSPSSFLETAKRAGLYQSISQIMFEKGIQILRQTNHRISINISAQDIDNQQSREFILTLVKSNPDLASRITLEITETEQIENYDLMKEFIDTIKAFGLNIALDDFGAGYSNFTHLLSLNIDYIKIDGSLIKHLDSDENALKITKAIVECARSLNIKMVAEYVHSDAIYQIVQDLGIEYCQGYLFGVPSEHLG